MTLMLGVAPLHDILTRRSKKLLFPMTPASGNMTETTRFQLDDCIYFWLHELLKDSCHRFYVSDDPLWNAVISRYLFQTLKSFSWNFLSCKTSCKSEIIKLSNFEVVIPVLLYPCTCRHFRWNCSLRQLNHKDLGKITSKCG